MKTRGDFLDAFFQKDISFFQLGIEEKAKEILLFLSRREGTGDKKLPSISVLFDKNNHDIAVKIITTSVNAIEISLSFGMIRFLSYLNVISFSGLNYISSPHPDQLFNLRRQILNAVYTFFDIRKVLPHSEIFVPRLGKKGFLFHFGLNEDTLSGMPIDMVVTHQIEFILLHELYHASDYTNTHFDREFEADLFAMSTSREIWGQDGKNHNVFCEFFQLTIFIYFDFYEFFRNAVEKGVILGNPAAYNHIELPKYLESHPPAWQRFEFALKGMSSITEYAKLFFQCVAWQFSELKKEMVSGNHNLFPLKLFTNITLQEFLKKHFVGEAQYNDDSATAAKYSKTIKVEPQIDFSKFDINFLDPNIWLRETALLPFDDAIKEVFGDEISLSEILTSKFGEFEQDKLIGEAGSSWTIIINH